MSKIPYDFNPFGKADSSWKPYGPTNGLVFYAPLEENEKELTRGELSTSGSINFTTQNELKTFTCTTSQYGTLYTDVQGQINDANVFSFSFWMNRAFNNYQNGLFFEFGNTARSGKKAFYIKDYYGINPGIVDGGELSYATGSYIPYQKWFHCVMILDRINGRITLYVDGQYKKYWNRDIFKQFNFDFNGLAIGSNLQFTENWKNGYLCGFRLYNRELTQSEVTELSQEYIPKYNITASDQTFRFTPVDNPNTKNIVYSSTGTVSSFEIISGELPNTITFNTTNGTFSGKALTDANHTYNLVVRMSGANVITKDINVTINTVTTTNLSITSPQTFNYITEREYYQYLQYNCEAYDYGSWEIVDGSLPNGLSMQTWDGSMAGQGSEQPRTWFSFRSTGTQSSSSTSTIQVAVSTTYHPTPVYATINLNVALNQITVPDKSFIFYIDDGSASKSVAYTTQNTITPVYSLSGTLPSGFTFDSSTGTFTYDGVYDTPTSGEVNVILNSSTGCSTQGVGKYTFELKSGSAPIPDGVWLYCPCKDGSTFECENESVTIGKTGSPNFYTAAQEGRDCMEITNVNEYATSTFKNIYFNGCYSGSAPIPTLDQSRSVAYWIKIPSNIVFYTGHGQGIFDYGYAAQWQDFRNAIVVDNASNPTIVLVGCDNYNGLPPGTITYGTDENIHIENIWSDYGWHLITYTYDHDTKEWKGYVDGTLQLTKVFTDSLRTARDQQGPLVIGLGNPSRAGHTKQAGAVSFRISDFRLWRRALTQAEVTKLYNLGPEINVEDKSIKFYTNEGQSSVQVTYTSNVLISPIYTLSGTLPTGITFDSSTGTFTYDGTTTTPASGSVNVGVAPSGTSNYVYGNYSLEIIQDAAPLPTSGLVFYAPLSSTTTTAETGDTLTFNDSGITAQTYNGIPCLRFPGSRNQYISAPDTNMQFGSTINNTISLWMNTETVRTSWIGVFGYGKCYLNQQKMLAITTGEQNEGSNAVIEADYNYANMNSGIPSYNAWHHVCFTSETSGGSTTGKIYIDGILKNQVTKTLNIPHHQNNLILIGQAPESSSPYIRSVAFAGYLAGVRIYNRVLTQTEITRLAQEFTPTT